MKRSDFIGQKLVAITEGSLEDGECTLQFENGTLVITATDNDGRSYGSVFMDVEVYGKVGGNETT